MSVTKESILATKPPQEPVEWINGEQVYVAAMSGKARDSFERENVLLGANNEDEHGHLNNFRARLLVRCLVSESGERLFTDDESSTLGEVWCEPLDRAFTKATALNGYSKADAEALEKNS